ncbi:MAG: type I pullulanase [Clostridiales bacterium]|jgi:type I pullulanase|nr:type I pullulanase [Clostridiales bacterium]
MQNFNAERLICKSAARRRPFLAATFVLSALLFFFSFNTFGAARPVTAAGTAGLEGTLYVSFYRPDGKYESNFDGADAKWSIWAFSDGANGRLITDSTADADFGGARVFAVKLSGKEVLEARRGSNKLGIVAVPSYQNGDEAAPLWEHKDIAADRTFYVPLNENNAGRVYIIAGDPTVYFDSAAANAVINGVRYANFDGEGKVSYVIGGEFKAASKVTVTKRTYNPANGEIANETPIINGAAVINKTDSRTASLNHSSFTAANIDLRAVYLLSVDGSAPAAIDKTRLFISPAFQSSQTPAENIKLGAVYTSDSTAFRLWAPTAAYVKLNLYRRGDGGEPYDTRFMTVGANGVMQTTVRGDLDGAYYTYSVCADGTENETIDIYAQSAGVNGKRGMVIDLDKTDPNGWNADLDAARAIRGRQASDARDPVIWEVHVRDFSAHPDSGIKYKGKYLAFTEDNTTLSTDNTVKTGIAHLKELGVTYVHLMPVFDFGSIDEAAMDSADSREFNWGYDPVNYNVPEGGYSTDPYDGRVRVNEFKQMVRALHNADIGVIMDVVYNHTVSLKSAFNASVPGYYYRQAFADGAGAGSFGYPEYAVGINGFVYANATLCGSETASEREMFGRYMKESVKYWATEYHMDGFRFDLMAVHNIGVMNEIRAMLNNDLAADGGAGILMYGEPWAAGGISLPPSANPDYWPANHNSPDSLKALADGIGIFNDVYRNAVRGDNSTGQRGYVNGWNDDERVENLKITVQGTKFSPDAVKIDGAFRAMDTVTYTACHDNRVLLDQLIMANGGKQQAETFRTGGDGAIKRQILLAAGLTLTSRGMILFTAGDEFARTKYGNHDSYSSSDRLNALDYGRKAQFAGIYSRYTELIKLRSRFLGFRVDAVTDDKAVYAGASGDSGSRVLWYQYRGLAADPYYSYLTVVVNPYPYAVTVDAGSAWAGDAQFRVIYDGANPVNFYNSDSADTVSATAQAAGITVAGESVAVLVKYKHG